MQNGATVHAVQLAQRQICRHSFCPQISSSARFYRLVGRYAAETHQPVLVDAGAPTSTLSEDAGSRGQRLMRAQPQMWHTD